MNYQITFYTRSGSVDIEALGKTEDELSIPIQRALYDLNVEFDGDSRTLETVAHEIWERNGDNTLSKTQVDHILYEAYGRLSKVDSEVAIMFVRSDETFNPTIDNESTKRHYGEHKLRLVK